MARGGTVEGIALTPNGEPAANVQLALALEDDAVLSARPGELSTRYWTCGRSDLEGQFKLTKPVKAKAVVAFHDSGWAIAPVTPGAH